MPLQEQSTAAPNPIEQHAAVVCASCVRAAGKTSWCHGMPFLERSMCTHTSRARADHHRMLRCPWDDRGAVLPAVASETAATWAAVQRVCAYGCLCRAAHSVGPAHSGWYQAPVACPGGTRIGARA